LVVWSALSAGVVALLPRSERSSSDFVKTTGVRLIRRTVDNAHGSRQKTPLEIYLPPQRAQWDSAADKAALSSGGVVNSRETTHESSSASQNTRTGRPVVIAIHGGSWIGGSPRLFRLDPETTVQRLAQAGLVVVVPEYRLASPGNPSWPAVLEELREVLRWVRRHAAELEIDPQRIAAMGQSAGGQLAALLGTSQGLPGPDGVPADVSAVINFYGPSDLALLVESRRLGHEPVRTFLGQPAAKDPGTLRDASPVDHVTPDAAAMLLLHGSDDTWVLPEQSARLAEALKLAGVRHELILVDGARHGFEPQVNTVPRRDLLPDILGFLRSVWNNRGNSGSERRQ
jgi:acetyl esterase/lipase